MLTFFAHCVILSKINLNIIFFSQFFQVYCHECLCRATFESLYFDSSVRKQRDRETCELPLRESESDFHFHLKEILQI